MTKYTEMRKAANEHRLSILKSQGHVYKSNYFEVINGTTFGLLTIRQGMNGCRAEQTLHYVNGMKVSAEVFKAYLAKAAA